MKKLFITLFAALTVAAFQTKTLQAAWTTQAVDSAGDVGKFLAMTADASGNAHIAYVDSTNLRLKYAKWTGSAWSIQNVGSGINGSYPSIALDASGNPHIAYKDNTNSANYGLKYAKWNGTSWVIQTVQLGTSVGDNSAIVIGSDGYARIAYSDWYSLKFARWTGSSWNIQTLDSAGEFKVGLSLALNASGNPRISYIHHQAYAGKELKYAQWNGSAWSIQILDTNYPGADTSLALDTSGNPLIAYVSLLGQGNHNPGVGTLKIKGWNGSSWISQDVDATTDIGPYCSLKLDKNNLPHISYYHKTTGNLRYASNPTGTAWVLQTVDSALGTSSFIYNALALDQNNLPRIAYYDITNANLKYAKVADTTVPATWTFQTVDASVGGTANPNVVKAAVAADSAGNPHIAYYDQVNLNLKYAKWNGSSWAIEVVDSAGDVGQHCSIALDGSNNPHIAYYDLTNQHLKMAKKASGSWTRQTVDAANAVGVYTSIAVDSNNRPHIAYHDYGTGLPKYAAWTGSAWSIEAVDYRPQFNVTGSIKLYNNLPKISYVHIYTDSSHIQHRELFLANLEVTSGGRSWANYLLDPNAGDWSSIDIDAQGTVHVSYQGLKYAKWSGAQATLENVGTNGSFTALALDGNSVPHVAYIDSSNQNLRYATKSGTAWSTQVLDAIQTIGSPAIDCDNAGNLHVAYYNKTSGALKYAKKSATTGGGSNLVNNPGFESAKTGWSFPSVGSIDASVRHSGTSSAKLVRTSQGTSSIYNSPRMAVSPNTVYTVSAWMKRLNLTGGSGSQMAVEWFNSSGGIIRTDKFASGQLGTADWAQYSANKTSPSNAVTARVKLYLYNSKGTAWYDDVSLVKSAAGTAAPAFAPQSPEEAEVFPDEEGTEMAAPANAAASDLSQVKVYPNPFRPGSGGSFDASVVTFAGLTRDVKIAIYGVTGEKIAELSKDDNTDTLTWDTRSSSGESAASGTYLCRITNSKGEKRTNKLAIIR